MVTTVLASLAALLNIIVQQLEEKNVGPVSLVSPPEISQESNKGCSPLNGTAHPWSPKHNREQTPFHKT